MKQFHFSLQALRTLRERQEQFALQTYSKALEAVEEARSRVQAVQRELEAAWAQIQQRTSESCAAGELNRMRTDGQSLELRKQTCEHAAKVARNKASQAFTKLLAARQGRAVVDKFFEKQKRLHRQERRRHEQHALDEMTNHQDTLMALVGMNGKNLWS